MCFRFENDQMQKSNHCGQPTACGKQKSSRHTNDMERTKPFDVMDETFCTQNSGDLEARKTQITTNALEELYSTNTELLEQIVELLFCGTLVQVRKLPQNTRHIHLAAHGYAREKQNVSYMDGHLFANFTSWHTLNPLTFVWMLRKIFGLYMVFLGSIRYLHVE